MDRPVNYDKDPDDDEQLLGGLGPKGNTLSSNKIILVHDGPT